MRSWTYAFSGLKCEAAPTNELGSKYLSVKLADGSELQSGKLYTMAVQDGTVAGEIGKTAVALTLSRLLLSG